jgi:hypothetical protein
LSISFINNFHPGEKMHSTGNFLDKKYTTQNAVLTMQDETGVGLENLAYKFLTQLAQQAKVLMTNSAESD